MAKKRSKLIRYLVIVVLVLLVFTVVGKKQGWIGGVKPLEVTVEKAEKRTIVETVSATGKIQPEIEVAISSDVSGEVVELFVKEGDSVIKGDLLARIDPAIYITTLDRSKAALNNARANLANSRSRVIQAEARFQEAKASYDRNLKLYKQDIIAEAEFEPIKSAYLSAQAEVSASEQAVLAAGYTVESQSATVAEAEKNLQRTNIYAPTSGTVSRLSVEQGERVVGTSQMAGTEMMRIADLLNMEVEVEVNENDIVRVSHNDTASIEVDAYIDQRFKGVVTEIANSANLEMQSADQVTNFTVKIRILRSSYESLLKTNKVPFRPGMSAAVEIATDEVRQAMCVPIEAVTVRGPEKKYGKDKDKEEQEVEDKETTEEEDEEEKEVVFLIEDGKAKQIEVKTGIQDDRYIQILEGLKDEQEVITGPYSAMSRTLKDGKQVKAVSKDKLFSAKKGGQDD